MGMPVRFSGYIIIYIRRPDKDINGVRAQLSLILEIIVP
jgi:hypothetical protein